MQPRTAETVGRAALSVLDRIKATAKNRKEDAQLLIVRYALQRFLHRMSVSPHSDILVIKGGMMMPLLGAGTRPTEDIDGHSHIELDIGQARAVLAGICDTDPTEEDGLVFDAGSIRIAEIRDEIMPGFRASLSASMRPAGGKPTDIRIKIDLCFGDVITPEPVYAELPSTLKGFAPVRVAVYPWPTVVAEKLHALARHGFQTSRMKDLYDLALISRSVPVCGKDLSSAIASTFKQWGHTPPSLAAEILVPEFAESKVRDWAAFLKKKGANTLEMPDVAAVVAEIAAFTLPALEAASAGEDLESDWMPGDGWRPAPANSPPGI